MLFQTPDIVFIPRHQHSEYYILTFKLIEPMACSLSQSSPLVDKVYFITDNPSSIYVAMEAFLASHLSQECHNLHLIAEWS